MSSTKRKAIVFDLEVESPSKKVMKSSSVQFTQRPKESAEQQVVDNKIVKLFQPELLTLPQLLELLEEVQEMLIIN